MIPGGRVEKAFRSEIDYSDFKRERVGVERGWIPPYTKSIF